VTGGYTHPSVRLVTDRGAYFLYLTLCCLTDGSDFGARVDAVLQRYLG
jgi:hypothetical protein